jgi:hypothetical protein
MMVKIKKLFLAIYLKNKNNYSKISNLKQYILEALPKFSKTIYLIHHIATVHKALSKLLEGAVFRRLINAVKISLLSKIRTTKS